MFRTTVAAAAIGAGWILSGAVAHACSECPISTQKQAKAAPQRAVKPVRNPVATAAGRVVKTASGYANASMPRPPKQPAPRVQVLPVVVSPDAAQALALAQALTAQPAANVRLVAADEVNEIDLAAKDTPITPILVPTSVVAMVDAKELNAIDQKATAQPGEPREKSCQGSASASLLASWFDWMRSLLDRAYETVAAVVAS